LLRSVFVGFICLFALAVSSEVHAQTRLFHPGQSGLTFTRDSSSRGGREYSNDWRLRASYTHKGIFDIGAGSGRDFEGQPFSDWSKVIYGTIALVKPVSHSGFGVDLHGQYTFQKEPSHLLILLGHVDPVKMELYTRTFHSELKFYSRHSPTPNTRLSWGLGAFYRFHKNQYLAPNDEVLYGNDDGQLGAAVDLHFLWYQRVHFSFRYEHAQAKSSSGNDLWAYDTMVSIGFMVGLNHGDKEPDHE
jgi:hypothetical protein